VTRPNGPASRHHDHAHGPVPDSMRRAQDAELRGVIHGECGDTMEIYLRLSDDLIHEATFMTDGGDSIIACGVALTEMVRGRTPGADRSDHAQGTRRSGGRLGSRQGTLRQARRQSPASRRGCARPDLIIAPGKSPGARCRHSGGGHEETRIE